MLGLGLAAVVGFALMPAAEEPLEPLELAAETPEVSLPETTVPMQTIPLPDDGDAVAVRFALKGGYLAVQQRSIAGLDRMFMGHISREGVTRVVEVRSESPEEGESLRSPAWMRQPVMLQLERCVGESGCTLARMPPQPSAKAKSLLSPEKTPSHSDHFPTASLDGRVLTWIGDGDLYSWPRGGEEPVRITESGAIHGPLSWGEDGRVAFSEGEPGARRVGLWSSTTGELSWLEGGDRVGPAIDRDGRVWWLEPQGDSFALRREGAAGPETVASPVWGGLGDAVALSERGDHVAYAPRGPEVAGRVVIRRLSDGTEFTVDTGLNDVGGMALAQGFGQMWLAATGVAPGDSRRQAVLADVTPVVGEQEVLGTLIKSSGSPGADAEARDGSAASGNAD